MGRFRVFNSNSTYTCSEYNKKKEGITILKDLRSKNTTDKIEDFTINFCDGTIINYKSYDIFINTVKSYNYLNPNCDNCINKKNNIQFPSKIEICNCTIEPEPESPCEPEPESPCEPEPESPCEPEPESPCEPEPEPSCEPEPESPCEPEHNICCRCKNQKKCCKMQSYCKKQKKCGKLKLESDKKYNSVRDLLFKKI